MSILDRSELAASPLADLHAIATELGLDGFRRLRKAELIDAIVVRQGGSPASDSDSEAAGPEEADDAPGSDGDSGDEAPPARPARSRRRGRRGARAGSESEETGEGSSTDDRAPKGRERAPRTERAPRRDSEPERLAEGVVELLNNGSGFLRVNPPDASDEDVYISAAQVRRCELVSGDRVAGPVRSPRRSERYPSLIRVDTINGDSADRVAEGAHYEDLPATFATERFELGSDDPTLKAIEWLTPLGRGSRATIVGGPRAGKTEALRRLAQALSAIEGLQVSLVLCGARPEELGEWTAALTPTAAIGLGASAEAQSQAVERAVQTAQRIAARGENAVVLIDTLDGLNPPAARRALAAARNIVDGGSLTVVATATRPLGGETTVIALDAVLTSTGRLPALDLVASGTMRPELLVGAAGAEAIAQARAAALT